jgi:hypothetical protein
MNAVLEMPRKRRTFKLDERVLSALADKARSENASANNWLETHLFMLLKAEGFLAEDAQPLGETRGGQPEKTDG